MKNPKISVIMAVYNSEKFLSEAIESVLNQTSGDFEFLIIDDCSTDNSLKIIEEYRKKDNRIVLIKNKKNLGRPKTRNKGLKIAKGKYIAILDSDDISLPERFKIQYDFLEKNKDIFLLGTRALQIDEFGSTRSISKTITDEKILREKLIEKNQIYHPSIMFRNSGKYFYREKFLYSQDYDFFLLLLSEGKRILNIPDILIQYRINPQGVSWNKNSKQKLFALQANRFYKQRLKFGKDKYNKFNPKDILKIDVNDLTDITILDSEIKGNFKMNNFKTVRHLSHKYFQNYGYLNTIMIYYVSSFLGKRIVNFIRKIIFLNL
jgi:glycosyltransferase involved in cell wall biosynthesis